MKLIILCFMICFFVGCFFVGCGCNCPDTAPAATPSPTQTFTVTYTAQPSPSPQNAQWVEKPYLAGRKQYDLTCRDSGKIIAEVFGLESWNACGGDGGCYGKFRHLYTWLSSEPSVSCSREATNRPKPSIPASGGIPSWR